MAVCRGAWWAEAWFDYWDMDQQGTLHQAQLAMALEHTLRVTAGDDAPPSALLVDVVSTILAACEVNTAEYVSRDEFLQPHTGVGDCLVSNLGLG